MEPPERFGLVASPHAGRDNPGRAALGPYGIAEVWPPIGAIGKDRVRIVGQRLGPGPAVVDIGRGDGDFLHKGGVGVGPDMSLEAVNRGPALVLDLMGLAILLAGRGDDGGIDQRAGLDLDRLSLELGRDGVEQRLIQFAGDQSLAEANEGRAFRRRLVVGKAAEPPERRTIVERLGESDIGKIVPHRQQHRLEQGQRRPGRFALGGTGNPGEVALDRQPIDQLG